MNENYLKILSAFLLSITCCFAQVDSSLASLKTSIRFSIVGDVMAHQTQLNYAINSDSTYDFHSVFSYISPYITQSDFAIANFESACAGSKREYKGYPVFNTPDTIITALKDSGFDHLITANNHILDMGVSGAKRTMNEIIKRGLDYSGSNRTESEKDSIKVYEVNNIKFTILSYTYFSNFNNIGSHHYIVNKIDLQRVEKDIAKAKGLDLDVIIVYYHFGTEEQREPDLNQEEIVKKTISFGADIILGGHPHRLQPIEVFNTNAANIATGFVAYSMGNFVSNQRWRYNDAGAVLYFTIEKEIESGKTSLSTIEYLPTWVFKGFTKNGREFIVLPSQLAMEENPLPFLTQEDIMLMKESYQDCIESFNKYSAEPILIDILK
ncbi:MAG: CapA family protein [Bacteroidetes bacterium]|nr:CapA family protein [Bacteroidota bacterium]